MPIERKDVLDTARLARLALTEPEVDALARELGAILAHMDALRALDTEGVEPMTHVVPTAARLRADEVGEAFARERALAGAPAPEDGYFSVPKIIERDG